MTKKASCLTWSQFSVNRLNLTIASRKGHVLKKWNLPIYINQNHKGVGRGHEKEPFRTFANEHSVSNLSLRSKNPTKQKSWIRQS